MNPATGILFVPEPMWRGALLGGSRQPLPTFDDYGTCPNHAPGPCPTGGALQCWRRWMPHPPGWGPPPAALVVARHGLDDEAGREALLWTVAIVHSLRAGGHTVTVRTVEWRVCSAGYEMVVNRTRVLGQHHMDAHRTVEALHPTEALVDYAHTAGFGRPVFLDADDQEVE